MNRFDIALGKKSCKSVLLHNTREEPPPSRHEPVVPEQGTLQEVLLGFIYRAVAYQLSRPFLERMRETHPEFKREFLTLSVGLPIRMGNTQIAVGLYRNYNDAVIITHSHDAHTELLRRLGDIGINNGRIYHNERTVRGCVARIVIMDEASWIPKPLIDSAYCINAEFFIKLG